LVRQQVFRLILHFFEFLFITFEHNDLGFCNLAFFLLSLFIEKDLELRPFWIIIVIEKWKQ